MEIKKFNFGGIKVNNDSFMNRIDWKTVLKEEYFSGLSNENERKAALDEWLVDGNFSCVKKENRHLIRSYMKQENLTYPSEEIIASHKKKRSKDTIIAITFSVLFVLISAFIFLELSKQNDVKATKELEHLQRVETVAEYLNAQPSEFLIKDDTSYWNDKYEGDSSVIYKGNQFHVEMNKNEDGKWKITKWVQLPNK